MTNTDMLHKAIDDPQTFHCRNSGKTTIMIHKLAGQIQVGEASRIIVMIRRMSDLEWLIPMLRGIFHEQGVELTKRLRNNEFCVVYNGKEVILTFLSISCEFHNDYLRGLRDIPQWSLVDY